MSGIPIASSELEFEVFEAPHEQARQPSRRFRRLDEGGSLQQLTEHEGGTDAEMRTLAERDVPLADNAIESKRLRIIEM